MLDAVKEMNNRKQYFDNSIQLGVIGTGILEVDKYGWLTNVRDDYSRALIKATTKREQEFWDEMFDPSWFRQGAGI